MINIDSAIRAEILKLSKELHEHMEEKKLLLANGMPEFGEIALKIEKRIDEVVSKLHSLITGAPSTVAAPTKTD